MKKLLQWCFVLCSVSLYGFEVNTHQALTRCATTTECGREGAKNLDRFIKNAEIDTRDGYYSEEIFEGYDEKTYKKYAESSDSSSFDVWQIKVKGDYLGMIEAGVVLEDAVYIHSDHPGDGRFNNHFYAAQFDAKAACVKSSIGVGSTFGLGGALISPLIVYGQMQSNKALCLGYGTRTDNISWALKPDVDLGRGRHNDYNLKHALDYFKTSFSESTEALRRKYQAKLFVSIGSMIHLLQDLHSPAHCRDGSHPGGDYLEIYGRYNGGFNLRDGNFNGANNPAIMPAIAKIDMKGLMLEQGRYATYRDFFEHEAGWVSKNFFSEAHDLDGTDLAG